MTIRFDYISKFVNNDLVLVPKTDEQIPDALTFREEFEIEKNGTTFKIQIVASNCLCSLF